MTAAYSVGQLADRSVASSASTRVACSAAHLAGTWVARKAEGKAENSDERLVASRAGLSDENWAEPSAACSGHLRAEC